MIEQWLGTTPVSEFLTEFYLKHPFSKLAEAARFTSVCTWETLGRVLSHPGRPDVLVAQEGRLVDRPPPRSLEEARALMAAGISIVVRNAEEHDLGLLELARAFEKDFRGPVVIQLFASPAGQYGFGWHYDVEEVFLLQTAGAKDLLLRENTVNPNPLRESIPADMGFELETSPVMACTLIPGDWVYLPAGCWHVAKAEEDALSVSIGVSPPTAIELFDLLRTVLVQSPAWRQRIPPAGGPPGALPERMEAQREMLEALGQALANAFRDPELMRSSLAALESRAMMVRAAAPGGRRGGRNSQGSG